MAKREKEGDDNITMNETSSNDSTNPNFRKAREEQLKHVEMKVSTSSWKRDFQKQNKKYITLSEGCENSETIYQSSQPILLSLYADGLMEKVHIY